MRTRIRKARRATGALLLALLAACAERSTPVAPAEPEPLPPAQFARLECKADVRERTVTCGDVHLPDDPRGLIVGGQNVYTRLVSSNSQYDPGTQILSADVTVENLLPQPMGTLDGTTPSGGVQVFFHSGPTVTSGTGSVSVANADGVGTFTSASQPYFQYSDATLGPDGILSQHETSSAKRWEFDASPNVQFSFVVFISTDVPYSNGWIDISGTPQVLQGGTRVLSATVRTWLGEVVTGGTITWSTSNASIATVSSAGVVTGVAPGKATITATDGTRTGSMVMHVCSNSLAVGGTLSFTMPGDSTLCFGGQSSGAEYVVIPINQGGTDVPLSVTATGIVPVVGAPSPTRLPGTAATLRGSATQGGASFERGLRVRERRELAGLLRAGRQPAAAHPSRPRWNLVGGEPVVGDLMPLNVRTTSFCSNADVRTGRVAAVGTNVVVLADTANPAGGFTSTDYQGIAATFDTLVWPTVVGAFGAPGDEDGNGRVALFFTRAVNQGTPSNAPYVPSFFLSRDLLSTLACPTSNVGEMIYLAVPDPSGLSGDARSHSLVTSRMYRAMGHDLQHLLNASHRLYLSAPPEETWLNEGLSGVAEELLFHAASGKAPRQNLGFAEVGDGGRVQNAFLTYGEPNFARLREWLKAPHVRNPAIDSATHTGAWAFLRYAADRLNGNDLTFWNALANSSATGVANLQAALGGANDAGLWLRDFTVALYTDDAVPNSHVLPSWNYRSLYNALDYNGDGFADGYPLAVRNPSAGVADAFTLSPGGGAAYLRMGVGASGTATVTMTSNGATPPSAIQVIVTRRK